jgi:hypothetical protein
MRAHPFIQGRKANPKVIRNLAPRKPAGQRYPHRFFAKFILTCMCSWLISFAAQ